MINSIKRGLVNLVATPILAKQAATEKMDRREFLTASLASAMLISSPIFSGKFQEAYADLREEEEKSIYLDEKRNEIEERIHEFEMAKREEARNQREREYVQEINEEPIYEIEEGKKFDRCGYDPGNYSEGEEDVLTLARAIYAEARGEWQNKEVLLHKGSSFLNRMDQRDMTLNEVIFEPYQYSFLTDDNKDYFYNTGECIEKTKDDKSAWDIIYDVAEHLIENGPEFPTTHTYHEFDSGRYRNKKQRRPNWTRKLEKVDEIETTTGTYEFYEGI